MRAVFLYLLVAVACTMIKEANSTPGFWADLLEHCPLLSHFFPNCCCDYDNSCCPTTTSTTSTTTTTTTTTPRPNGRRKRWIITTDVYNNLSDMAKQNATRNDKQI